MSRSGLWVVVCLGLLGCSGPKLYVTDLQVLSFDGTTLTYQVEVTNGSGSPFCSAAPVKGPIAVQAWSAPTQDVFAPGRRAQGGREIVTANAELAPGASVTFPVPRTASAPFVPGRDDFLIVQVYTSEGSPTFPNPASHDKNSRCKRVVVERAVPIPYGN